MRHFDGGDVSFMLALSPRSDYDGGGTQFDALANSSNILHLDQGDLVLFDANLFHEGVAITRGSRYLLVGFTCTCTNRHSQSVYLNLQLQPTTRKRKRKDHQLDQNGGKGGTLPLVDMEKREKKGKESKNKKHRRKRKRKK